jgi:hypothetical protein
MVQLKASHIAVVFIGVHALDVKSMQQYPINVSVCPSSVTPFPPRYLQAPLGALPSIQVTSVSLTAQSTFETGPQPVSGETRVLQQYTFEPLAENGAAQNQPAGSVEVSGAALFVQSNSICVQFAFA